MTDGETNFIEVEIGGLVRDNRENPIVLLKVMESEEVLPIWIGHAEALSIELKLQGKKFDRPLTHDLLRSAIFMERPAAAKTSARRCLRKM